MLKKRKPLKAPEVKSAYGLQESMDRMKRLLAEAQAREAAEQRAKEKAEGKGEPITTTPEEQEHLTIVDPQERLKRLVALGKEQEKEMEKKSRVFRRQIEESKRKKREH